MEGKVRFTLIIRLMVAETPFLSIIFPAYNEELRLPDTLTSTLSFTSSLPYLCEIVIAENGSNDRTLSIARDFTSENPTIRVLHIEQAGKGRAVQAGMLAATGQYRFICDVDLSMPITEIPRFLPPQTTDADIGIQVFYRRSSEKIVPARHHTRLDLRCGGNGHRFPRRLPH